ncbi:MAG: cobalt-precorrin-6A reductase [Methylobacterium sp.]|jgi:precorrin-6A/cobalt-precorrin-6A reductase|uniref:cobalt-precorrin-6A reductase n=1 Tax=unclassified Methylobacterium TaxID=2615210 RepID=UPI0006F6A4EB|nr:MULTISPECIES: cobalt-precorrin-6A reductase [unclassified Methylobacterium]KQP10678.1 cobalt-precorrin-6X reductase [Methylobacterium sp. Leaf99]MDO9426752.1 cobalt-precorrin-6A reductase [Methylobacterium sp.]
MVKRLLILGGTGEASALVRGLPPGVEPTLSLAGRTAAPKAEPVPTRIGGFGGVDGLADWIEGNRITHVIDATHPFAARIAANAAGACARTGTKLLAIRRPAWEPVPGDRWRAVADMGAAVTALGAAPCRVFLTVGRQEVGVFAAAPQHDYVVRSIEPVALAVPRLTAIVARGPFAEADEAAFLRDQAIAVVVSKNSGGAATYGKITAARGLGLPVVMVARPPKPDVPSVADAAGALAWLAAQ